MTSLDTVSETLHKGSCFAWGHWGRAGPKKTLEESQGPVKAGGTQQMCSGTVTEPYTWDRGRSPLPSLFPSVWLQHTFTNAELFWGSVPAHVITQFATPKPFSWTLLTDITLITNIFVEFVPLPRWDLCFDWDVWVFSFWMAESESSITSKEQQQ